MKTKYAAILLFFALISCAHPKPRKPISYTGRLDMSESIALNKKIYEQEMDYFFNYMKKDTLHTYINSKQGFWYAFDYQKSNETLKPTKGDLVTFSYNVVGTDGKEIYSQEELGEKTYRVDQQDFMQGIQEGIKLMKVNEKVIFLLPSQKAYAFYGDGNRIGTNTPVIVNVELTDIKNK